MTIVNHDYHDLETVKCPNCRFLYNIFNDIKDMTNREYWVFTEMFVYLHYGKDYCDYKENK